MKQIDRKIFAPAVRRVAQMLVEPKNFDFYETSVGCPGCYLGLLGLELGVRKGENIVRVAEILGYSRRYDPLADRVREPDGAFYADLTALTGSHHLLNPPAEVMHKYADWLESQ